MLFKNANLFVNGGFRCGAFRVENGRFSELLDCTPDEAGVDLKGASSFRGWWTCITTATPARTSPTATMTASSKWRGIWPRTA